MPPTPPPGPASPPAARAQRPAAELVVAALGAAVLAGCTGDGSTRPTPSASPTPPPPDPDLPLLESALADEDALLAQYAGLLPRVGGAVRVALAALSAHHGEHRAALLAAIAARRPGGSATPDGSPLPSASGSVVGSAAPSAGPLPASPAALVQPEQLSAQRALTSVRTAADARVGLLLAETAASHAQHAVALRGIR